MKIKNIFKKEIKIGSKTNIQSLDKNQLEKVIGGTEITPTEPSKSLLGHELTHVVQQGK